MSHKAGQDILQKPISSVTWSLSRDMECRSRYHDPSYAEREKPNHIRWTLNRDAYGSMQQSLSIRSCHGSAPDASQGNKKALLKGEGKYLKVELNKPRQMEDVEKVKVDDAVGDSENHDGKQLDEEQQRCSRENV